MFIMLAAWKQSERWVVVKNVEKRTAKVAERIEETLGTYSTVWKYQNSIFSILNLFSWNIVICSCC